MATTAEIQYAQDYMGVAHGTADTLIGRLLDAANKIIHRYVGFKLTDLADTYTEYLDGTGTDTFWTERAQITSITSIHISEVGDWDDVVPVDTDLILFDTADLGKVNLLGLGTGSGFQAIKIVYAGGYATLPDEVQLARAMIAAGMRNRGQEGAEGFKQERLGDRSVVYDHALIPEAARNILNQFRRRTL